MCVGGGRGGGVQGPACRPAKAMLADFGVRCTFSHEPRLVLQVPNQSHRGLESEEGTFRFSFVA